ncbi:hypothetical protein [Tardiphaga sp.]|uniref:hypothetical protein n=1 Tax=Tardiphaga sp. TaxID=1926292 RepID=UPI0026338C4C|nr:hypothetical protein [Tardiphaga sp.]
MLAAILQGELSEDSSVLVRTARRQGLMGDGRAIARRNDAAIVRFLARPWIQGKIRAILNAPGFYSMKCGYGTGLEWFVQKEHQLD